MLSTGVKLPPETIKKVRKGHEGAIGNFYVHLELNFFLDICWPFRIENRPIVGKIMVASRDIKATEVVLEEFPAAW